MNWFTLLATVALTFGVLFLIDKGFSRLFRNRVQHKTGKSVHLAKAYALGGLLLSVLSLLGGVSVLSAEKKDFFLLAACGVVLCLGAGLLTAYLSFGVYYDEETFLCSSFGKKSVTYRFEQIVSQQLYNIRGGICINLLLENGRELALYANMQGVYPFLDQAFLGYCRQKGIDPETASFHDPENSLWFPSAEKEA